MKKIETEIEINSTPDKIWSVLTNFRDYPGWNPFIKSIKGSAEENNIKVFIQPPDGKGMEIAPNVLIFEKNKEFRWKGKLIMKGIFDGEHYFKLLQNENGTVKFVHGELFSGILVGFTGKMLEKVKIGFAEMNEALKKECEKIKKAGF